MKNTILSFLILAFASFAMAQEKYTLTTESTLTINGTSTVHDWVVTANTLEGSATVEANVAIAIDCSVLVADIKSERGATMDKKMHKALAKETHPNVTFFLKEIKDETTFLGTLNIAGVEQEVEVIGKMDSSQDGISIVGEYEIALQDYAIEPPTAMFGQVIVGDLVTVKFNLVFKK